MNFITAWFVLNALWWGVLCFAIMYVHQEEGVKKLKECGFVGHLVGAMFSIPISIYILMGGKAS